MRGANLLHVAVRRGTARAAPQQRLQQYVS